MPHYETCAYEMLELFHESCFLSTESSSSQQEGGLHEAAPEVLHLILTNLLYGPKDQFGNKHRGLSESGMLVYRI